MLFNSFTFVGFFCLLYGPYRLLQSRLRVQNALLLLASYIFYSVWDVRFSLLILASTLVDYLVARKIPGRTDGETRRLLYLSLTANLGSLAFFKYYNFFSENLSQLLNLPPGSPFLNVVLPVGISFYTFQSMSYTIDVFRGEQEPCESFLDFALYVSFFPRLVAGPIERAGRLLEQIQKPRIISTEDLTVGLYLIIYGYFKKVVIADNLGQMVNRIFNDPNAQGADIWCALIAFCFQIYGDFSGYSSIARGLARLLGFKLVLNFNLPYFSLTPSEFWTRWHISLSQWLRDYLYVPLGGNRGGVSQTYRNLMLTMVLGGLWHGAAWNFVLWGLFHGFILCLYRGLNIKASPSLPMRLLQWQIMFMLTLFGWLLFRAKSWSQVVYLVTHMSFQSSPGTHTLLLDILFYLTPLLLIELWQHKKRDLLVIPRSGPWVLAGAQAFMLTAILVFGYEQSSEFIYFQF